MAQTRELNIGGIKLGGSNPIVVQTMLNMAPYDAAANLAQIECLVASGCELIRMTVPRLDCIPVFAEVCKKSPIPVVADIHFRHEIAIESIKAGAAKIRINPGNIGGLENTAEVLQVAKDYGVSIRIGVNAGSLDKELKAREDLSLPQKLAKSAIDYVEFFENSGFDQFVVSTKAHDCPTTIETYRILHREIPQVPLHLGITEAGTAFQGLIKSSVGIGVLLEEGIGDTLRISLTDDPVKEVRACWTLLSDLGLRRRGPEIISCPTCGRTDANLFEIAKRVEDELFADPETAAKDVKVAVMGCMVNGPGEAKDADLGVVCSKGCANLFINGEFVQMIPESEIVSALMAEIKKH
ncbi:MAG: flavodoxin-dependent (E)-4-hydroxy-3-methylbut-2-enyl-diphosphate synthase [Eggerthellaceae bacterium]|nr:flavodoxin-dependent (E)-4-hydroxy-3-methylbut-2-enyl-diphosphate synthase [Eggerthellaceae bacterium]